jgi:hypothetical protein
MNHQGLVSLNYSHGSPKRCCREAKREGHAGPPVREKQVACTPLVTIRCPRRLPCVHLNNPSCRQTGLSPRSAEKEDLAVTKSVTVATRASRTSKLSVNGLPGEVQSLTPAMSASRTRTPFERSRWAADASRDTIWQGNCNVADLQLRSTIAPISNTIPIQYPISNCPAKKGFLQTALSKARRSTVFKHVSFVDARFR